MGRRRIVDIFGLSEQFGLQFNDVPQRCNHERSPIVCFIKKNEHLVGLFIFTYLHAQTSF